MSGGTIIGGAAIPFLEARLPWSTIPGGPPSDPRTIVLYDSLAADGKFVLYALATQLCNKTAGHQHHGRILWLSCGPVTHGQIRQGLRKMGCSTHIHSSAENNNNARNALTIQSVIADMANRIASRSNSNDGDFDVHVYLQEIYQDIQKWATIDTNEDEQPTKPQPHHPSWILVDDISALASLCGEGRVYSWLLAVQALSSKHQFGILLRANGDTQENIPHDWFGAAGNAATTVPTNVHKIPWERTLVELADGIIDVSPLTSGYTRDVHGRMIWTSLTARGWRGGEDGGNSADGMRHGGGVASKSSPPLRVLNFCITDDRHKIMAYIL